MRAPGVTKKDLVRWDLLIEKDGGTDDEIKRELAYAACWIRDKIASLGLSDKQLEEVEFAFGQRVCATSEFQFKPYEREEGALYGIFEFSGIKINRRHHVNNIWMLAEWVVDRSRQGVFDKPGEELAMALTLEFSANFLQMRRALEAAVAAIENN